MLSALRSGHEVIDAGEVIGVEVVLELLGFDGIVELRQVVLSHNAVEHLQVT